VSIYEIGLGARSGRFSGQGKTQWNEGLFARGDMGGNHALFLVCFDGRRPGACVGRRWRPRPDRGHPCQRSKIGVQIISGNKEMLVHFFPSYAAPDVQWAGLNCWLEALEIGKMDP